MWIKELHVFMINCISSAFYLQMDTLFQCSLYNSFNLYHRWPEKQNKIYTPSQACSAVLIQCAEKKDVTYIKFHHLIDTLFVSVH